MIEAHDEVSDLRAIIEKLNARIAELERQLTVVVEPASQAPDPCTVGGP